MRYGITTIRFILLIVFAFSSSSNVFAATDIENQTVVRVGYYEDGSYMSKNEEGDYIGYNFEYLYEVAKYAGWKYEIVDGGSWENTLLMLQSGEIDVLPSVYYTKERKREFLFPEQQMCSIYTTLNVRSDDMRYDYEDFETFNGMRVGVIRDSEDARRFKKYCKLNKVNLTIVPYAYTQDLLNALETKELDGIAISHLGRSSKHRSVAKFSPSSLYTIVSKERPDLLTQLNAALNIIKLHNPNYDTKLFEKYFSVSASQKPVFTKEELKFIQESEVIKAVYNEARAPLEYTDQETGEFRGVVADLFQTIEKITGLTFEYIPAGDAQEAVTMVQDTDINVLCATASDYLWNSKNDLNTTQYFLRSPVVQVSNRNQNIAKRIALQKGEPNAQNIEKDHPKDEVIRCKSARDCFETVRNGEADSTFVNTYIAEYLLSDRRFEGLRAVTLSDYSEEMSIGVNNYANPLLFSILDKCIQYMAAERMDELVLKNSISINKITWIDIFNQHPFIIFGGTAAFFSIIILLLVFLLLLKSRSEKKIQKLLYRDGLTDLWNINKFRREVIHRIQESKDIDYAVLYLDIKEFRIINDTWGFDEGNEILCALARILETEVSNGECCARVSADQFVLLFQYEDWDKLTARTDEIDRKINTWVTDKGQHYHLNMVFGVYVVTQPDCCDVSLMLDFASYAKRSAAVSHKTIAVRYNEKMRQEGILYKDLADHMQYALENGEFLVYFQPKVDMPTGELVGSEALVRWDFQGRGVLPPGMFIPLFEKNGFVTEVDMNVFEQVCKTIQKWMSNGWKVHPVSCNFSRIHFKNPDFPNQLVKLADHYKIPHEYLELEVTESAFVGNLDEVLEHFAKLKRLGFPISIDDFGSGYSSLGLLQRFAVDIIKLDRTFIQEGMCGEKEQAVVHGVIQLIKSLDMKLICEGVENEEQVKMLTNMECYTAQGYYYAKPMELKEFEKWIQKKGKF